MSTKERVFQITAAIAALYHLTLGLAGLLLRAGTLESTIQTFLGFVPEFTPALAMAVRFAGAYVLAFGVMMGLLALNPRRYRVLCIPALVLFGVRLVNRILLFGQISELYSVSPARNLFGVGSLAVLFVLILATAPKQD